MALTVAEARELHDTCGEALNPIEAWALGNIAADDALLAVAEVLRRVDAAALSVLDAGGAESSAQARLDAKDAAIRALCHDLRHGATVLKLTVELIKRYAERGDLGRMVEKADLLAALLRQRVESIEAGEATALAAGAARAPGEVIDECIGAADLRAQE